MTDLNDEITEDERGLVAIVTEDEVYGKLLEYGLSSQGYPSAVLDSGPAVGKQIERLRPAIVVVDLFMAITDGFKFLGWLRKDYVIQLPILVLVSSEDRALTVELLVAGADDVFVKPVSFPAILESLKTIWDRHPLTDENAVAPK